MWLWVHTTRDFRFAARAACHSTRRPRTPRLRVDTRLPCPPPVTVRSGRDGVDPDEVGGACNRRRSAGSARPASPGRRMDSTGYRRRSAAVTTEVTVRSGRDGLDPDEVRCLIRRFCSLRLPRTVDGLHGLTERSRPVMFCSWTRTRLEVPAIAGDPPVLLAPPPPDGGWTPRLDRTVTAANVLNGLMDSCSIRGS